MMFKVHDDWKRTLSAKDESRLNEILRKTAKHRPAYRGAHDVKIAQIWSALLEMDRENVDLRKKLKRMESVFEAIADKMKEENGKEYTDELKYSLDKL
jgi:hypothetical protein